MSKIKTWLEEERINEIERRYKIRDFDFLYVFTNKEARPIDTDNDCFFQLYGDISGAHCEISVISVETQLCACDECRAFEDLNEYVAIRTGLTLAFELFGNPSIWLWVSSKRFVDDFYSGFENSQMRCEFRRRLIADLVYFFDRAKIQVEEYDYHANEVIPFDVTGRTSDSIVSIVEV